MVDAINARGDGNTAGTGHGIRQVSCPITAVANAFQLANAVPALVPQIGCHRSSMRSRIDSLRLFLLAARRGAFVSSAQAQKFTVAAATDLRYAPGDIAEVHFRARTAHVPAYPPHRVRTSFGPSRQRACDSSFPILREDAEPLP